MDFSILRQLNDFLAAHDGVEDPLTAYAKFSEPLFLAMLVLAFVLVGAATRRDTRRAVVAAGFSAALGLAVAQVVSRLVDRPRPFVDHPHAVHLFARHAADPGFPSDHTTAAFAIAVALLLRRRAWGTVVLALACLLAVARVGMAVHYPTDVLGGAVIGTLAALALSLQPLRARLDRLADASGRVLDAIIPGRRRGTAAAASPRARVPGG